MADKIAEAFVEIRAHLDRLESDFGSAKSITKRETNSLASIGNKAMSMAGAGIAAAAAAGAVAVGAAAAGMTALAAKSLMTFSTFEKGMNEVFTMLPGISKEAMGTMSEQVVDFGKKFGVLPTQVVPALYSALSAGVPKGNVFEFLETAQKLAKAGVTDLNTAVEGLAAVVNAYGAENITAEQTADLMFATVKGGINTIPELAANLATVTPVAAELGVSFRDVSAWTAQLTAQKVPVGSAMSGMRQAMLELRKEGTKVSDAFQDATGGSFREFMAQGHNVAEALEQVAQYAEYSGVELGDLFGSAEAGGAVLAVTGDKLKDFKENLEQDFSDVTGSIDEAFNTMDQGGSVAMEKLAANMEAAYIRIGAALSPAMEPAFAMLNELLAIAEEELLPAFQAIGETLGMISPDASGAKDFFAAIADGMVFVVDAILSAAVAMEDVAASAETIVWIGESLLKMVPAYWAAKGLMSLTEDERSARGLSARENLEKFRAEQEVRKFEQQQAALKKSMEPEPVKVEIEAEVTPVIQAPIDTGPSEKEIARDKLRSEQEKLEWERMELMWGFAEAEAYGDSTKPKFSDKGFVNFEDFGRQLQEQLFDADEKKKTEEFQRKMDEYEREKAAVLKKNADDTKRIADKIEKLMVAT